LPNFNSEHFVVIHHTDPLLKTILLNITISWRFCYVYFTNRWSAW